MIYGDDKIRNIVRSVLPSKMRVRKHKRSAHKRNRAMHRTAIRRLLHTDFDEYPSYDPKADTDVSYLVVSRRDADKLGPLMRWATYFSRGRNYPEAVKFVRRIMPRGLVGDHAMGHVEWGLKWRMNPHRNPKPKEGRDRYVESLRKRLYEVCMSGGALPRLNSHMAQAHPVVTWHYMDSSGQIVHKEFPKSAPRLTGVKGIDAFIDEVLAHSSFRVRSWVRLDEYVRPIVVMHHAMLKYNPSTKSMPNPEFRDWKKALDVFLEGFDALGS
jgi:hypothetical protein